MSNPKEQKSAWKRIDEGNLPEVGKYVIARWDDGDYHIIKLRGINVGWYDNDGDKYSAPDEWTEIPE